MLRSSLRDGQIVVDAGKDDLVRLVMNGVSLESSTGAPIYSKKADKTVIILANGTENTVTDAAFDSLDSNGNIFLEGGTVYLNGSSMGMDGATGIADDGSEYTNMRGGMGGPGGGTMRERPAGS